MQVPVFLRPPQSVPFLFFFLFFTSYILPLNILFGPTDNSLPFSVYGHFSILRDKVSEKKNEKYL